jgi:hypothetical protein
VVAGNGALGAGAVRELGAGLGELGLPAELARAPDGFAGLVVGGAPAGGAAAGVGGGAGAAAPPGGATSGGGSSGAMTGAAGGAAAGAAGAAGGAGAEVGSVPAGREPLTPCTHALRSISSGTATRNGLGKEIPGVRLCLLL